MKMRTYQSAGFTLVEMMIIVGIIGTLTTIAASGTIRARNKAAVNTCINNLTQIARAKTVWSFETRNGGSAVPDAADLFKTNGFLKATPVCPMRGEYSINAVDTNPTCTYPDHELEK
mgnify:FL=1